MRTRELVPIAALPALGVAVLVAASFALDRDAPEAGGAGPYPPTKIAFIGDQGLTPGAGAVLDLIVAEGAEAISFQGDFDYQDDPDAWESQFDEHLPPAMPVLASIGNHDLCCVAEYAAVIQDRLDSASGVTCEGELLIQSTCTWRGLHMVFTAPGLVGSGYADYIEAQLASTDAVWRICSWHANQRLMQVGGKGDATGWGVYDNCREGGGIVATGHEPSYSRTHLMSSFESQTVASTSDTLVLEEGRSFAFVSGLGGHSVRPQVLNGDWWASIYTSTQGANVGALFCTFYDGEQNHASCYYKDIAGNVPDQFELVSNLGVPTTPTPAPTPPPTPTPTPAPTPVPTPTPTPVPDSDGDGVPDPDDNCPAWPNASQALPPWFVPTGDPDCDGHDTAIESYIGTLPLNACAATSSADDEDPDPWGSDANYDRDADVGDVIQLFGGIALEPSNYQPVPTSTPTDRPMSATSWEGSGTERCSTAAADGGPAGPMRYDWLQTRA